uniref:Uncharacterized protein n=1 Tax=Sinocyclocheilus grahami TaxID=75366 RepID=A0A672PMM1_SINGR
MDLNKWCDLKSEPRLKHLTEAHIESFDQAVTDGLCRGVEVRYTHTHTHTHTHTSVSEGGISNDLRVFSAECRGRCCTYTEEILNTSTLICAKFIFANITFIIACDECLYEII